MINALLTIAALVLLGASFAAWSAVLGRWRRREPLVERSCHDGVPWGLLDVVVAIAVLILFQVLAETVVVAEFGAPGENVADASSLPYYRGSVAAQTLSSLATLVVVASMVLARRRLPARGARAVARSVRSDLSLGVVAFLVLAPPTYAMQLFLVRWFPSKHPLLDLLQKQPDPALIVLSIVSAVVVAPVFEEFLFRGLLQGWLENLVSRNADPWQLLLGRPWGRAHPQRRGDEFPHQDCLAESPTPQGEGYSSLKCMGEAANPGEGSGGDENRNASHPATDHRSAQAGYSPVVISSLLFAALHVSHGPDWIPLFFLALGLGYLYRQTHRLLPCITVHFLLNACSMAMFLAELLRV